jgi:hypothetical protein
MTNPTPEAHGWSFAASGRAVASEAVSGLEAGIKELLKDTTVGREALQFLENADGWLVTANGRGGGPAEHDGLFAALRGLISRPEVETGSSSFTSPFVSQSNFHLTSTAGPAPSDVPPADAPGQAGTPAEGAPADAPEAGASVTGGGDAPPSW